MDLKKSLTNIIKEYSSLLDKIALQVEPLNDNQSLDIDVSNIADKKVIFEKGTTNVLYIITVDNIPDEVIVKSKYSEGRNRGWALPQYNNNKIHENGKFLNQKCLYVGSSKNDINTRLKQHIGITEGKTTSALHLSRWWNDAKIHIYLYKYFESDNTKDFDALQIIEDTVWDICKPYFGKKGPRARKFSE
jgi:hypothetical protein